MLIEICLKFKICIKLGRALKNWERFRLEIVYAQQEHNFCMKIRIETNRNDLRIARKL